MQSATSPASETEIAVSATVVEHHRLRHDLAVIRLECTEGIVPFHAVSTST